MMKLMSFMFLFCTIITMISCEKNETVNEQDVTMIKDSDKLKRGTFVNSSAHSASGEAFLYKEGDITKLGILNFKTDNGPDLRVYMATDRNATDFVEVSGEVKNGSYSVTLPTGLDTDKYNYVLIWCKQFSVLFGSAVLSE